MSRDIEDRLSLFGAEITFKRVALNMDQVRHYNPPPNPAKETDARFRDYEEKFGDESWELDALDPKVLSDLVRDNVLRLRDDDAWARAMSDIEDGRDALLNIANRWGDVVDFLKGESDE